ncbi:MAG TPA: hypothetical protein VF957_23025, partial [Bradyrhizobium sp.]
EAAKAGTMPRSPMASAGKINSRRSIFIVSSVLLIEGSLAATLSFVEHPQLAGPAANFGVTTRVAWPRARRSTSRAAI